MIQNFVGEATIAPPLTLRDLANALSNPTVPEIDRCIRVGKQETWRKMGLISTRFRIAQALEALARRRGAEREGGVRPAPPGLSHDAGGLRDAASVVSPVGSPRLARSLARTAALV